MKKIFSIKESFIFGWRTTRAHSALIFKVVLTVFALQVAFEIVNKVLVPSAIGILAAALLMVFLIVAGFGATIILLKLVRGTAAHYSDLLPPVKLTVRYVLASMLTALVVLAPLVVAGIVVAVGMVLLGASFMTGVVASPYVSLPVLSLVVALLLSTAATLAGYLLLRYSFMRFAVLDSHTVRGSLRESARLVRGHALPLLLFFIVVLVLNLLGVMLFLVGLLITVPVTTLAYAHVYQKLKEHIETK